MKKKIFAFAMMCIMVFQIAMPKEALAFETKVVNSNRVESIEVAPGTLLTDIPFPDTIDIVDENLNIIDTKNVESWVIKEGSQEYNPKQAGTYIFVPQLSEGDVATEGSGFSLEEIKVVLKRAFQNPKGYYQVQNVIKQRENGGYNLSLGRMGLKVLKVNNYFHIGNKYWPRYSYATISKVKNFQKKHKLKVTGVVDRKTWLKMGFSEDEWYNLGAYISPTLADATSTREELIEIMIGRAREYRGDNYVVGASGKPGQGVDCSGLVMQALYAAGIDVYPIGPVRHSIKNYEFESRNMYDSKKFKSVPYSKKKRGDLIFYCNSSGVVNHVAIYLGKDRVIEAMPNKVVVDKIKTYGHSRVKGVKRVFI